MEPYSGVNSAMKKITNRRMILEEHAKIANAKGWQRILDRFVNPIPPDVLAGGDVDIAHYIDDLSIAFIITLLEAEKEVLGEDKCSVDNTAQQQQHDNSSRKKSAVLTPQYKALLKLLSAHSHHRDIIRGHAKYEHFSHTHSSVIAEIIAQHRLRQYHDADRAAKSRVIKQLLLEYNLNGATGKPREQATCLEGMVKVGSPITTALQQQRRQQQQQQASSGLTTTNCTTDPNALPGMEEFQAHMKKVDMSCVEAKEKDKQELEALQLQLGHIQLLQLQIDEVCCLKSQWIDVDNAIKQGRTALMNKVEMQHQAEVLSSKMPTSIIKHIAYTPKTLHELCLRHNGNDLRRLAQDKALLQDLQQQIKKRYDDPAHPIRNAGSIKADYERINLRINVLRVRCDAEEEVDAQQQQHVEDNNNNNNNNNNGKPTKLSPPPPPAPAQPPQPLTPNQQLEEKIRHMVEVDITTDEVRVAIAEMDNFRAEGPDHIRIETLKASLHASPSDPDLVVVPPVGEGEDEESFSLDELGVWQHDADVRTKLGQSRTITQLQLQINSGSHSYNPHTGKAGTRTNTKQTRFFKGDGAGNNAEGENDAMIQAIAGLANHIWTTAVIPQIFQLSTITMLHKGGAKNDTNNYRPIALSSIAIKVVNKVLQKRIMAVSNAMVDFNVRYELSPAVKMRMIDPSEA